MRCNAEGDKDGAFSLVADEGRQQRGTVLHRVVVLRGKWEEQLQLRLTSPAHTHLVHVPYGDYTVEAVQRRRRKHVSLPVIRCEESTLIGERGLLPNFKERKSVST